MANESLEGIKRGKVTKPGQPVAQPFRYVLDGQKKAKGKVDKEAFNSNFKKQA